MICIIPCNIVITEEKKSEHSSSLEPSRISFLVLFCFMFLLCLDIEIFYQFSYNHLLCFFFNRRKRIIITKTLPSIYKYAIKMKKICAVEWLLSLCYNCDWKGIEENKSLRNSTHFFRVLFIPRIHTLTYCNCIFALSISLYLFLNTIKHNNNLKIKMPFKKIKNHLLKH